MPLASISQHSDDCPDEWIKIGCLRILTVNGLGNLNCMPRQVATSGSSIALDNLRAVVILIVLAFHAVLAYVTWIPATSSGFGQPPYEWRAFPIVDSQRWFGFDLFCAWQDVYLMSLMFLLSGMFVWPSLARKGSLSFVRDRFLRLGVPYIFGVTILMPLAFYPTYLVTESPPGAFEYLQHYTALPFLPNGQLWFLWQLLALNFVAIILNWFAPNAFKSLGRWSVAAGQRPGFYFAVLVGVSAIAYLPLALVFTPWAWSNSGLLSVQWCRPLLYGVYFFAGLGIGVGDIDSGLVAADGALARSWKLWGAVAAASLLVWMGVTSLTLNRSAPIGIDAAADLSFVVACAGGCFFVIAASLRFGTKRSRALSSLSANAYSLYLVHYDIVIWLQYALLATSLFAIVKGPIVFTLTLFLSWIAVLAVQRIPLGALLIAATPRTIAAQPAPAVAPGSGLE